MNATTQFKKKFFLKINPTNIFNKKQFILFNRFFSMEMIIKKEEFRMRLKGKKEFYNKNIFNF